MQIIEILFWICLFLVFYTYVGYGIVLYCLVALKRLICKKKDKEEEVDDNKLPHVTLMICAYNEQDVVDMKMENSLQLDYPKDKLHIVWVTDGSNDNTNSMLEKYEGVRVLHRPERRGKTAALNRGIALAETSIIIMTDANTMVNTGAVREVVRLFRDPKVGCVAGEKRVMARCEGQAAAEGEGLYWKYESALKRLDSELYSAMGAAGEFNAIRKELYEEMPEDTLLDDFIMSMKMVDNGYRIAYTADAFAMEYGSANLEEEGKRKRRIAAGGLQSIWRLKRMLNPLRHPTATFQYISHRVLRWSITP
ncbi:MAG: glycosyltransferase family 2 protein, partial [Prevotella sp.]|nr:glycosyltransferase family 2 protein [Prevotella sp.]